VTGELSSLLERWSRVEPDRCISPERTHHPERGEYLVVIEGAAYGVFNALVQQHNPDSRVEAAYVQAAVQEAIRAKGMRYQLGGYFVEDQGRAIVWPDDLSLIDSDACYGRDPDGRDAVALLAAYLTAVEAAKETT
jgi:hypothetical protein